MHWTAGQTGGWIPKQTCDYDDQGEDDDDDDDDESAPLALCHIFSALAAPTGWGQKRPRSALLFASLGLI